jgi:AraC family transcriptional regulator, regulatory protein of adaptative response / methylated-DNA-[protein]-cysteine methyltransferase
MLSPDGAGYLKTHYRDGMNNFSPNSSEIFYQAYLDRDQSFEGIFYLAVKTTGIFCRPGCKARAPKKENVEFFNTPDDAIDKGYRPCKKCQPLQKQGEVPQWVRKAMDLLDQQADQRISDQVLQQHDIDPVRLRRWFKQNYQLTFQNYQRMKKMLSASEKIKDGEKIIDTALDVGYQSLSGFNETFKQFIGSSPTRMKNLSIVTVAQLVTPLGAMYAGVSDQGVCLLEFNDRKALQKQLNRIQQKLNALFVPGDHEYLQRLQQQLDEYFAGNRSEFDIPLQLVGSEFQQQAWRALLKIPYAETRSYQQQAEAIENPSAIRAIASANAANAIAIVIPCHRVIAKSGSMAGYAGGIWRKQYLLNLEKGSSIV